MTAQSGSSRARASICSRFVARTEDATQETAPLRVVLAARLLWDKGIAEYVEAARALQEARADRELPARRLARRGQSGVGVRSDAARAG